MPDYGPAIYKAMVPMFELGSICDVAEELISGAQMSSKTVSAIYAPCVIGRARTT
jgi:hypothetical protein